MGTANDKIEIVGYPVYKNSGVEWLGKIPEHWEVRRIKYLFREINEKSVDGSEDLLSVSHYTGVTKRADGIEADELITNASTLEGYKKVCENDLVINIMLAWNGSLAFSSFNGITSPAYSVYRLNKNNGCGYFNYLLRTELYKSEYKRNSTGVIESRLRLYSVDFFRIWAILPPLAEQTAIANYLDRKTALIDKAISVKERQIALLKERRQAIIHKAVTKGLNPNVTLKPSGVDWIGDIPENWEVKKLKHFAIKIGSGITPTGGGTSYLETGIPLLRSQNILFGKIDLTNVAYISQKTHNEMSNSQVQKGDILLNITGGSIGRCHYVETDGSMNVNQHVCIIRPTSRILTIFFNALLRSEVGQAQIWFYQQGGGREGLNFQAIKNFFFPLPPIEEQLLIVDFMQANNQKVDTAISYKVQEIEKLKEYKASLINSAVTGKIKVF